MSFPTSSPQPDDAAISTTSRRWLRRTLLAVAALAVLLAITLAITALVLRHDMRANLLPNENLLDGSISISGLTSPVTITRNAQSVPSIHAATLDDLLFTQGYITASDRLFQMDALRRHGAGTLAEILGSSLVQHDREQRILQLRAAADRATAALPPDQLHQLQAYANGVNAYITTHSGSSSTSTSTNTLPIEFHLLHYTPDLWQPRDSLLIAIIMAQDLATDFPTKLDREALAASLPANLLPDLYPVGSWRDHPPTQDAPNLSAPSTPVLQIPLDSTQSSVSPTDLLRISADLTGHRCDGCRAGSNNWAVAGAHTATGAPLLSNDMHLNLTAPDIWYEAALHADGPTPLSVEGFTLPGVPFVIVGRNPYVAWGFTNSGADVQDVLIEHLRGSGSQTEYQRPDHTWAPVTHHREQIRVRAGRNVTLDVLTTNTNLGTTTIQTPIITALYPSEHRTLALAWTIYDPTTVSSPFLAINSATDAASLVAAFANFRTVSQNLVYADAHHIGYHLLGSIPIRGPAIQHPRTTQPFILPDTTPSEDDEDESGTSSTSLNAPPTLSSRPEPGSPTSALALWGRDAAGRSGEIPAFVLASAHYNSVILSGAQRSRRTPRVPTPPTPSAPSTKTLPTAPTTSYTIGSPLSPTPVDALDPTQAWSGYIPYDQLPSVLDPTSGIISTANARITPDNYPYAITLNWADPYRVERINHLLADAVASNHPLTPADMLRIQTDIHSEFDLAVAQRLAYALDHSTLTRKDPRLQQAANLLRDWNGEVSIDSPAAAIVTAVRPAIWSMLLAPQIKAHNHTRIGNAQLDQLLNLYNWGETHTALELILQNTPARWLPPTFSNWNDLLATATQRGLAHAPHNLSTFTYGPTHPIEIPHPIFGSHSPISTLLGAATGTDLHPNSGDSTTIKQTGLHFGPSERFTADLSNPDNTHANITTGESGNPASPWFLDQFQPWLQGTTFTLPLNHPTIQHTLTLTPN
jgi:penicillin amidase